MKLCKKCNIEKNINEFKKYGSSCLLCIKKYNQERKKDFYTRINPDDKKVCNACNQEKSIIDFDYQNKKCKGCCKIAHYDFVKNDPVTSVKWKNYYNNYRRDRYKNDIGYRNKCLLRTMLYDAFSNKGLVKNDKIDNILGCSIKEYMLHIENQFEKWMNWGNQGKYTGKYNETWQIDHIIPISSAKSEEDIIRLSHYTNLQPLCYRKNKEKGSKIIDVTDLCNINTLPN